MVIRNTNTGLAYIIQHTKDIDFTDDINTVRRYNHHPCFLSFQSHEIAEKFLKNFKDLIEQAGDLI